MLGYRKLGHGDGRTAAVTDTPIYDQLRLELSSRRAATDGPPKPSPPKPRAAAKRAVPAAAEPERRPVSVWTLVNANRKA